MQLLNKHPKEWELWDLGFYYGLKIVVWEGINLQPLVFGFFRKQSFMGERYRKIFLGTSLKHSEFLTFITKN